MQLKDSKLTTVLRRFLHVVRRPRLQLKKENERRLGAAQPPFTSVAGSGGLEGDKFHADKQNTTNSTPSRRQ